MPTQPTEMMAAAPLVAPVSAPGPPNNKEVDIPAGEGDNSFNSVSSQDHSQQNKEDYGKETALGNKEGPSAVDDDEDTQDDRFSNGSDSSEENAIKSRAVAAAKASAAKEAAARDALLNPRRASDKPVEAAPSSGQHTRLATDKNNNTAHAQAQAAALIAPNNAALYQSAMLRVQATISSLQLKNDRCRGHISADDLELLHSHFESMLTHHPIYSPNARRSRALAAASAMAQYRKTAMEAQQKLEINRMLQHQLERQGKDNATGAAAGGGGNGVNKSAWAPPTGQPHRTNPEIPLATFTGAPDLWGTSQGQQHSQASHITYFPGGGTEGGSPSTMGFNADSQQRTHDSASLTAYGNDASALHQQEQQQQPGSSFWSSQSFAAALAGQQAQQQQHGHQNQHLLTPPGQDPRVHTADLLRLLTMIMPQDQAASAYGSFAYDAAAAVGPPPPQQLQPQAQTGVDAEIAASALVALGSSSEPVVGTKRRGRPTKRYLDQDIGEETPATRRQRQGAALTEAGPRVLPPPPHITGSVEAELMSLLAQYTGQ